MYEIERQIGSVCEKAALKIIQIPKEKSEITELKNSDYDDKSITAYFDESRSRVEAEYALMAALKGNSNIVYCDDFRSVQHDDDFGWDIYIKMELLSPMKEIIGQTAPEPVVRQLGIDICSALVSCRKFNIVHRDIKPENIFLSKDGRFKLGDFGIARTMESTTSGTSTGTFPYMAPEIYYHRPYNHGVDIYSLGIVMYQLLNEGCIPFLSSSKPTPRMKEEANEKRFGGKKIPAPKNGSQELKRIVLKACEYEPKNRYQSADEMLLDLEALNGGVHSYGEARPKCETENCAPEPESPMDNQHASDTTMGTYYSEEDKTEATVSAFRSEPEKGAPPAPKPKKKKTGTIIWAMHALIWVGLIIGLVGNTNARNAGCDAMKYARYISAGTSNTVGLRSDGTAVLEVIAMGAECYISDWTDIVEVSAGCNYIAGLRSDGTVVITGDIYHYDRYEISSWTNMIAVSDGPFNIAGIRSDGTVLATGLTKDEAKGIGKWENIVDISVGASHIIGLRADGTVMAVGENSEGQCDVYRWKNIDDVSAGYFHTVGLCSDGTVVATGSNTEGQCDVSEWTDIIAVSAGDRYTLGLHMDGTVVSAGISTGYGEDIQYGISGWTDVVAISAGDCHAVGLCVDGTVLFAGLNICDNCKDVRNWTDIGPEILT